MFCIILTHTVIASKLLTILLTLCAGKKRGKEAEKVVVDLQQSVKVLDLTLYK